MQTDDILEMVLRFHSTYEEEFFYRRLLLQFIAANPRCIDRHFTPGHLTASAWIVNPSRSKALMIHHRKLEKWLQPGGHLEPDDRSIQEAAAREITEECGITDFQLLSPEIFDIDVHIIPEKNGFPEHLHYDVRFLFEASEGYLMADEQEVNDIQWQSIAALVTPEKQQSIRRMALKTRQNA